MFSTDAGEGPAVGNTKMGALEVHDPGVHGQDQVRDREDGQVYDQKAHGQVEADNLVGADVQNLSPGAAATAAVRSLRTGPGDPCHARGGGDGVESGWDGEG